MFSAVGFVYHQGTGCLFSRIGQTLLQCRCIVMAICFGGGSSKSFWLVSCQAVVRSGRRAAALPFSPLKHKLAWCALEQAGEARVVRPPGLKCELVRLALPAIWDNDIFFLKLVDLSSRSTSISGRWRLHRPTHQGLWQGDGEKPRALIPPAIRWCVPGKKRGLIDEGAHVCAGCNVEVLLMVASHVETKDVERFLAASAIW